ncbi:SDR family oxidoreductase [Pseudarthrobacter sp. R1]|uniref:SDR family NAD(P)-dependent oxidoreductase n=1 Tax=Pseudarthrobacter sp. R1 TaxID=2944934 RepID=UPI00210CF0A9|nr:SDR family oxidoreductase [Pseudarthrobacter sp. R1]MCQ6272305.1 SDR family oxidoreductase [Pseudarthrobacter sp. R1]
MNRFRDKVILVTGAGKGIGAATAELLGREGASLALFDIDQKAVSETAERITQAGGKAMALYGDARSSSDVRQAVEAAVREYKGLDGIAAIAGVLRLTPTEEVPDEQWREVVETNVKGPFEVIRAALPHLRSRGGGSIVLASSAMAFASSPGAALYSASKGALVSMTMALAVEFAAEGIRVNCVAPGTVRTPMAMALAEWTRQERAVEDAVEDFGKNHPMGRLIEADEVANVVAFLLSEEASAVTGSCYGVDAGLLANLA